MGEYIIPADERRFEEEIAGIERPVRAASLAGEYLTQAIEHLHDAGDPGYLYEHWRHFPPADPDAVHDQTRRAARAARIRAARGTVLYAAFAGEAYVNEFLGAHGVLDEWDRERTTRKFLKGTAAAYGSSLFFADGECVLDLLAPRRRGVRGHAYRRPRPLACTHATRGLCL